MRAHPTLFLAAALTLSAGAPAVAAPESRARYDGHRVVAVMIETPSDLDRMAALSDDPWSCEEGVGRENLYRVTPAHLEALRASGLKFRVEIEDVQTLIDAERTRLESAPGVGADGVNYFADYRDYTTTSAYIDTLVALNPTIASRFTVGNSLEGRAIFGIRITGANGAGTTKPGFWIESIQHAREWAVLPVNMWAADQLVRSYGVDPQITTLVDSIDFYIVPIVNPDGYVYTWGPDRFWRKNRRPNAGGTFGVDLNRNWSYGWGGTGSSGTPSAEDYRGTAAFSEPETLNVSNYIAARPHIRGLIDFHSNGQVCIFPWGNVNDPCPDHAELNTLGASITAAIQGVNGIYAPAGSSGAVLYLAAGNVRDWAYGVRGIRPTTLEVRTGSGGFSPPASAIAPTNAENWAAVKTFANWVMTTNPVRLYRTVGDVLSVGVNTPTPVQVKATTINGPTPGLAQPAALRWRTGSSGPFAFAPLSPAGGDIFTGTLPGAGCVPGAFEYYFEAQAVGGVTATLPADGAANPLRAPVGVRATVFSDNFETATGWTLGGAGVGDTATAGLWGRFNPISNAAQPEDDNPLGTGTFCYITSNGAVNGGLDADVDNGITTITSPLVDGSGAGTLYVSYHRWFSNNLGNNRGQPSDALLVQISNNNASSWTTLETVSENTGKWTPRAFKVSDFVAPTNQMRIRFRANDTSGDSCVEAGIDDVVFYRITCDSIPGDVNGDGVVNFADLNIVLSNFGQTGPGLPGDADGDGDVDFADLNIVLSNFGTGADGLAAHVEVSHRGGGAEAASANTTPPPRIVPGDIDGNGTLADADFGALLAHIDAAHYVASADLNRDGALNQQDLDVLVWLYAHPGTDGDCGGYPACCCIFYGEPGSCVGAANCAGGSGGGSNGTGEGDPGEGGGGGENEGGNNNNGGNGPPTRVEFDIDVYRTSGVEGVLDESLEETSGAFIAVNSDDDNYDGIPDNHGTSGQVAGENDLVRVVLRPVRHNLASPPNPWNAYLFTSYGGASTDGFVRLWQNPDRTGPIASGQAFDARQEHTIYLEGRYVEDNQLKLHYSGTHGGDWIKLRTVAIPSGPANVPDYSKHRYAGAVLSNLVGVFEIEGGVKEDLGPNECRVFWQQGPAVGVVKFLPSPDFAIRREVNVVRVSIEAPPSGAFAYLQPIDGGVQVDVSNRISKYVNPAGGLPTQSGTAPLIQFAARITLEGPNGNRGVEKIHVGFVQNLLFSEYRGFFSDRMQSLVAAYENATFLDQADGTIPPYYSDEPTAVFNNATPLQNSKIIQSVDTPRVGIPLSFEQGLTLGATDDVLDELRAQWAFGLHIVASTIESADFLTKFTVRARGDWSLDVLDFNIGQTAPFAWTGDGAGTIAPAAWTPVTTGATPSLVSGINANAVLLTMPYTPIGGR